MRRRAAKALVAIVLAAAAACDCGEHQPSFPTDVPVDPAGDEDLDIPLDGVDVPDVAGDPDDDATDVTDEDAVSHGGSPFQCETSGGGRLVSEHYTMELFVAPARPVGSMTSESYGIHLGPAGTRSP